MSNDKMRKNFEVWAVKSPISDITTDRYGRYSFNKTLGAWLGWQAALSQSEPAQVSQELSGWKIVWPESTDSVGQDYFIGVDNYKSKDIRVSFGAVAIPLFTSPPDYEALKENSKLLGDMLSKVIEERNNLELRVTELESEVRTKHEYAMQMLGERDALDAAYQRRESIIFPTNQSTSEPKDDLP